MRYHLLFIFLLVAVTSFSQVKLEAGVPFKDNYGKEISEARFRELLGSGNYNYQSVRNVEGKVLQYELMREAQLVQGETAPERPAIKATEQKPGLQVNLQSGVPFKNEMGALITEEEFRTKLASGKYQFFSVRNEENKVQEYQLKRDDKNNEPTTTVSSTTLQLNLEAGVPFKNEAGAVISEQLFRGLLAEGGYKYFSVRNEENKVLEYQLQREGNNPVANTISEMKPEKSLNTNTSVLKVGNYIPAFEAMDMSGNKITSESLKGKVVLLNFWFTTCKPCIDEVPALNEVFDAYKNNPNVVLLSPTTDNAEKAQEFITRYGFKNTICPKAKMLADVCEIIYYPTNIILDKNGVVRNIFSGSFGDVKATLFYNIEKALK